MPRYRSQEILELRKQLSYSPENRRRQQLERLESFLRQIDPAQTYPLSLIYYQVTRFRPPDGAEQLLDGQVVLRDLSLLLHELSSTVSLPAAKAAGVLLSVEEVKEMYDVSESTISRWRGEGLICKKYVFPGGKRKTGILESDLRAFIQANADRLHKSANLEPLGETARHDIAHRARVLAARDMLGLSEVARQLAEEFKLPDETILYALKRHDEELPNRAIFPDALFPLSKECKREVFRAYNNGESAEQISRKYRRGRSTVYRIVREMKAQAILNAKTEYIYNPIFDDANAEQIVLGEPLTTIERLSAEYDEPLPGARPQPAYLKEAGRTPLLSREEEADLFRRYNYIKYRLARLKRDLKPSDVSHEKLQEIVDLEATADAVKNRIIEANLRLVISIAKKHVGPLRGFNELVSDGNVSLMRAVEKFDYSRGVRFSTYASWAIMKNFAKSIPEENYQQDRFATGKQEVLEVLPDPREKVKRRAELLILLKRAVNELLDELTEREKDIIVCRYGLEDGQPHTLEQVGNEFSVTRERVRQIEHRALRKLRTVIDEKQLEDLE